MCLFQAPSIGGAGFLTPTKHAPNPITVGLAQLAGGQAVNWNMPMAGAIIAAFPVLIIYIFMGSLHNTEVLVAIRESSRKNEWVTVEG